MDDELCCLETELKRLRPRAASPDLLARLEGELSVPVGRAPVAAFPWRGALAWAAAIAVMAAVGLNWQRKAIPAPVSVPAVSVASPAAPSPPAADYEPVTAERTIYAAADEGVVTLADGTAAHRVRHHYVDTIVWRDSVNNASLRWSVPAEEVRLVPASIH